MKLPGYDAWLEKPYQDMWADHDKFERYADIYETLECFESDYKEWVLDQEYTDPDEVFSLENYRESSEYEEAVWDLIEADEEQ